MQGIECNARTLETEKGEVKDICNDKRILILDIALVIIWSSVLRESRDSRSSKDRDSFPIGITFRPNKTMRGEGCSRLWVRGVVSQ